MKQILFVLAFLLAASSASAQQSVQNVDALGNQEILDKCAAYTKVSLPISQTSVAEKLINAAAGLKVYFCSIMLTGPDTETISIVNGTGTKCATSTDAIIGGTTAATGPPLPFGHGNGQAWVAASAAANEDVCLFKSGSSDRASGVATYVLAP